MSLTPDYVLIQNSHQTTAICFFSLEHTDYLASGDEEGQVTFWDLINYKKRLTVDAHKGRIIKLQCNRSLDSYHKTIMSQSRGEIKIWLYTDLPLAFKISSTYNTSTISLCPFSALPLISGQLLLSFPSAYNEKSIGVCIKNTETTITPQSANNPGLLMTIKLVILNELSIYLLAGYECGILKLFQITPDAGKSSIGYKELSSLELFNDMITTMDFNGFTSKGICGSVGDKLKIFTLKQLDEGQASLIVDKEIGLTNPGINTVRVRPDSRICATSGWDSRVRLFSWKTYKPLAVIDYHKSGINQIAFSHKSKNTLKFILAIASADKTISLWSPYNNL